MKKKKNHKMKLEYMAAKKFIIKSILKLSYIFNTSSFYYYSCDRFQGCCWPNGETNYCFICRFTLTDYPVEIEKIKDVREII